ncbi:NepR family anti-sigma factor [Sulfitobacter sp. JL08]|uniref:NepR family anti-sigma factor n=2 Tax=unclassified Sulfitobacter TaxID=196795 RepID=UPI0020C77168|nr:NepR family anti-sigma factor [Sulfitobacter sp. JL08]
MSVRFHVTSKKVARVFMTGPTDKDGGADKKSAGQKDQIGENLKRVYDDIIDEEVPERFKILLRQLKEQGGDK